MEIPISEPSVMQTWMIFYLKHMIRPVTVREIELPRHPQVCFSLSNKSTIPQKHAATTAGHIGQQTILEACLEISSPKLIAVCTIARG